MPWLLLRVLALPLACAVAARAQASIEFGRDVRPILAAKCFTCHGPDDGKRKAGLRFDRRETVFGPRGTRPVAVVPGDLAGSELARRVTAEDPDERMPPVDAPKALEPAERAILLQWIREGARWEEHWSLQAPVRPDLPRTEREAWSRNGIDPFVLARLESLGRGPSPVADRATLARRVALDLCGLPPTPDELRAFLADEREDAYERYVDGLLASPRFGEHMAHFWLDAARYGDTHGLHLDNYREMWPYRDWVVAAFNRNLPYDQFVIEQLAGDLLPDATLEQRIASGFVRAHVTTHEGGSIVDEVLVRNVIDRVNTVGTVFLGLTVACAQCHDHKFDPVSQRDYYGLFAFLNNEDGEPMDGNAKVHEPVVRVPLPEQTEALAVLDEEAASLEAELAGAIAAYEYVEPPPSSGRPRVETIWFDDDDPPGSKSEGSPPEWVDAPRVVGTRAMRRAGEGLHQHFFTGAEQMLRIGAGDELFVHVWLDPTNPPREVMLQWNDQDGRWEHRAFWGEDVIDWGTANSASRHPMGLLPQTGRWVRLSVAARDVGLAPGAIVNGMAFTQHGGSVVWDRAGIVSTVPQVREDFIWIDDELPPGAKPDGDGRTWNWIGADATPAPFAGARAVRRSGGDGLNQDYFTQASPPLVMQRGDRLFAHVWLDPAHPPRGIQLQFNDGNWDHRVRWGVGAHGAGAANGADHVAGDVPETGRWLRLEVALADVGLTAGSKLNGFAFTQVGGTVCWDAAGVSGFGQRDDRAAVSMATWLAQAAADDSLPAPVKQALGVMEPERSAEQWEVLRRHYLRHVHAGAHVAFAPLEAKLADVERRSKAIEDAIPTTLVMRERSEMRPSFVLRRGEYDKRGAEVGRAVPAALPPMPSDFPRDRLGLARWLVLDEHPLTARVAVNRFWQHFLGVGIVKTAEDFGMQGEPPSHPALLDWLACEFREGGWDIKRLVRTIVTSATYMQSSSAPPAEFANDRENRLLARGPRHRLDAEVVRDQALFLGGLLVEERGGPGVKPPQPEGLWKAVAYVGSNTMTFVGDTDPEKVHRRSLYTFWKRTSPPPQMVVLDAPSREECRVRRERTNTPLQALLLLNDVQFVEAARGFAQRVLALPETDDTARIRWAFLAATGHQIGAADSLDLTQLLASGRRSFTADPEAARELVTIGAAPPDPQTDVVELAAWTVVTNLILNLDEVLTKN